MTQPWTVYIVAIGDELCTGRRQDTNGSWMARRLAEHGAAPKRLHIAGDDPQGVVTLLRALSADADLIVMCGGLGPTGDDTTRAALATASGAALVEHPDAWAQVQARLASLSLDANAMRRTQALVPDGAVPLRNDVGTAPGIRVQLGQACVLALPGVPREMKSMFEAHILPLLPVAAVPARASIWTACVPEADVARQVEAVGSLDGVALAYYAHHGEVEVVITGSDADTVQAAASRARDALGAAVFEAPAGGRLQHSVVASLRQRGETVAVAESLTGGGIAHALTDVPGSSDVLAYGWIVYADAAKQALGVTAKTLQAHGVVSDAVAQALATAARQQSGATYGLATTGVAGPGPFVDAAGRESPAGRVFLAVAGPQGTARRTLDGGRTRAGVRRFAVINALDLLRRHVSSCRSEARGNSAS